MKLKSTLWALAFACAAVSCSDDLDDGPNNNGNNEEMNGVKTYVKVAINTGVNTKASSGPSTGPNGGEGTGTELGEESEYMVKDVTLVLFDNTENNDADVDKSGFEFLAGSNIRGVGFAEVDENGSSSVPQHGWAATVEVVMDEKESTDLFDKKFGVIAVTNLGKNNDLYTKIKARNQITKGKALADYISSDYQTTGSGFIMSTHAMEWKLNDKATPIKSVVEIKEGVSESEAPLVHVFVERLAAKIRIKNYTDATGGTTISNFLYTLTDGGTPNPTNIAKVRLDEVAIVNQLTSGSYLLKRVSDDNPTAFTADMKVNYLADEKWDDTETKEVYNYVMDPWIVSRTATATLSVAAGNIPALTYDNRFTGTNYASMWKGYSDVKKTAALATAEATAYNDNGGIRLAYTQENVTQSIHSLNGYSTGALFKATYFPDQLTVVSTTGDNAGLETTSAFVSYDGKDGANTSELDQIKITDSGVNFYEYRGNLYATQEAIFIDRINNSVTDQDKKKGYTYAKFKDTGFTDMTIADFEQYFSHIVEPFGYIKDLNDKVEDYTTKNPSEKLSEKTMNDLTGAQNFNTFMAGKAERSFDDAKYYAGGVCYYPYWIRHANNNKASVMGIMEFAIVRNNIYELTVSGMKTWGFSGTDVPDPEDPDEDGTARINVNLYVKNWVVRSNSGIIL